MIIYNVRVTGALSAVLTPIATVISGAIRSFLVLEVDLEGMGTASQANEVGIYRVGTAGVTGSSALTFTPTDQPNMTGTTPALAFSGTGFAAYATQPLAGALVQNIPINANGQRYFWRANANLNNAIPVQGGNNAAGSIGLFPLNTAGGTVTGRMQLAEI
jgi:hypothetical protein